MSAVRIVRAVGMAWVASYTAGLPAEARDRRRREIESDMHVVTLGAISFAVTYSSIDSVGAADREGATVVRMKEIKFAPKELTASAGERIRLVVENDDLGSHTFVLKAAGVDEYFGAGDERLVEFSIAEPGAYEFKCDIEGHDKMKGTIIVE